MQLNPHQLKDAAALVKKVEIARAYWLAVASVLSTSARIRCLGGASYPSLPRLRNSTRT